MGTYCTPLCFCYERDFVLSLSDATKADIIEAFNTTTRYLDSLLNIVNPYFEGTVTKNYPTELQLNKTNTTDTEAPFFDSYSSSSNGFVSSKIYDKRIDFDYDIANLLYLEGDVLRDFSYDVYKVCKRVYSFVWF